MNACARTIAVTSLLAGCLAMLPMATFATAGLPERQTPAGLRLLSEAAGGRVLEGRLSTVATSGAAFRAGIARMRGYFDAPAQLLGAVRSKDGTLTLALFKATLRGTRVGGFLITTFVRGGTSRADVLFDRVDRVGRSMSTMLAQVTAPHSSPAAPAAAGAVADLHDVTSQDDTVHARLPAGWHTPIFAQGEMVAIGPNDEEVDQEVSIPCVDPNAPIAHNTPWLPVTYTRDVERAYLDVLATLAQRRMAPVSQTRITSVKNMPAPEGAAVAELIGSDVAHGVARHFDSVVFVSPLNRYGGWSISLKMIAAPQSRIARDLPTLLAIFKSYNVDQQARGRQVAASMEMDREGMARGRRMAADTQARNTAVFNASMNHARAVQQSIDRSTSGFVHYLNDTTVVEGSGGARASIDADFAQSIVNDNAQDFRIVPVSEYRSGD